MRIWVDTVEMELENLLQETPEPLFQRVRTSRSKFSAPSWCLCHAYSPKPGQRFWNVFWDKCRLGRCYDTHGVGVLSTFLACAHVVAATPRMGWGWGGVVMLTFLTHMFLHLHTWSCGWGGGVAMLTFPAKYSIPPSLHTLLGNDEVNPKTFAVQKVAGELHWW